MSPVQRQRPGSPNLVRRAEPIVTGAPDTASNGQSGAEQASQPRPEVGRGRQASPAAKPAGSRSGALPGPAKADTDISVGLALSQRDQRYLIRVTAGRQAAAQKKLDEAMNESVQLVAQLRAQGVNELFLIAGFAEVGLEVPAEDEK